jgi:hypothetical protein
LKLWKSAATPAALADEQHRRRIPVDSSLEPAALLAVERTAQRSWAVAPVPPKRMPRLGLLIASAPLAALSKQRRD